jgi:hypothetical protein
VPLRGPQTPRELDGHSFRMYWSEFETQGGCTCLMMSNTRSMSLDDIFS